MRFVQRRRIPWQKQPGDQTPDLLFVGAGLGVGALAFLWAGYLGKPGDSQKILGEPWTLFGYFCLVILALEALVLIPKHPSRAKVIAALAVTCVWIGLVAWAYIVGRAAIANWLNQFLAAVAQTKQLLFVLVDVVSIVLLWLGIRFASYNPRPSKQGGHGAIPAERLAGDLLLSTMFSALLAWVFFWPIWQAVATLDKSQPLSLCDLTWVPYHTDPKTQQPICPTSPLDLSTIFALDLFILPLMYLLVTLIILLIGTGAQALKEFREKGDPLVFVEVFRRVVLDIVERRIKDLPYLLLALRYFWPALLLVAVVLVGVASKLILLYLFSVATASQGHVLWLMLPDILHGDLHLLGLEFGAAAAVLLALALTVIAATVWAIQKPGSEAKAREEVQATIEESWRHVRFIGLVLAVAYWALSAVFSIINQLALIGVTLYESVTGTPHSSLLGWYWAPFVQPDALTLLSVVVFLIVIVRLPSDSAEAKAIKRKTV